MFERHVTYLDKMQIILIIIWTLCVAISHGAVHVGNQYPLTCSVIRPFDSPLVTATLEQQVQGTGCKTNVTVPNSGTEVHIIRYLGTDHQNVQLIIHDYGSHGYPFPFLVVLWSASEVRWQVRITKNPLHLDQNKFVIQKGHGLKFANKQIKSHPKILKHRNMPGEVELLLPWVTKKYGVVTSVTTLEGGDSVMLTVGEATASADDQDSVLTPQCTIQDGKVADLAASALVQDLLPVEGCLVETVPHNTNTKHAYVIELKHVQYNKPFEVNLEIRRQSRQTTDKEFCLVLKSPSHVTWRVHTRRVQGYINIVANSFVDMSGIRMHTVAVRSDELDMSGRDLLHWVEYYLGPVVMYASMNNTNNIQVILPQIPEVDQATTTDISPKQMKLALKRAMFYTCDEVSVTVAIQKTVLQMLGIKKSMLSLLDHECGAMENSTHIYLSSMPHTCGTDIVNTEPGKKAIINSLVIHQTTIISSELYDDSLMLSDKGSGSDNIYSGSGDDQDGATGLDDEDLSLRPLQIQFMCTVDLTTPVTPVPPVQHVVEPTFELQLFQDSMYKFAYARFPVVVEDKHRSLYLQATILSNRQLQAHIQHCWLSAVEDKFDENKYYLVKDGCSVDKSVSWHQSLLVDQDYASSQRLQFTMENFVRNVGTNTDVFLKCRLTVCCNSRSCGQFKYPKCELQANCFLDLPYRTAGDQFSDANSRLVILGKLTPPTSSLHTDLPTMVEVQPDLSDTESSSRVKDSQGHVIIEGLDSGTVVGIAFAAFIIGVLMMGALWFIHTHSGSLFTSGPFKRNLGNQSAPENEGDYVETTPGSSAPISA